MDTYISTWRKGFDITGRARRTEFWLFWMLYVLVLLAIAGFGYAAHGVGAAEPNTILALAFGAAGLWSIAGTMPSLTVLARRFHDAGISSKWPVLGYLALMVVNLVINVGNLLAPQMFVGNPTVFVSSVGVPLALYALGIFVVTLLPSQPHDNRWGPNPKAPMPYPDQMSEPA